MSRVDPGVPSATGPDTGVEAALEAEPAHPADRGLPVVANRAHFPCADGLRAIAALSVLVHHVAAASGTYSNDVFGPFFARMDSGVSVFFVLSGFLLYRPFVAAHLAGGSRPALWPFWWRRFLRIVPAYWLVVTVFIVVGTISIPTWQHAAYLYSFGQIYSKAHVLDGLVQAWSLCVEVTFYLFLPILALAIRSLAVPVARRLHFEIGLVVGLYAVGIATHTLLLVTHDASTPATLWLPSQIDLFALGMFLAVISAWIAHEDRAPRWVEWIGAHPWLCWIGAAAAFFTVSKLAGVPAPVGSAGLIDLTTRQEMTRQVLYGATAFLLVLPAVFGPQEHGVVRWFLRAPVVAWLGLISYGIYLWHKDLLVELVGRHDLLGWVPGAQFLSALAVVTVLTIAAAAASYYVLERPVLRLKGRVPFTRRGRGLAVPT